MNNIIAKTEWIQTWSENGVGWIQLNHKNKLNPLSSAFILAIKDVVVVFPWVPAIAIDCFSRINSPNISDLCTIGRNIFFAAIYSSFVSEIAVETTIILALLIFILFYT